MKLIITCCVLLAVLGLGSGCQIVGVIASKTMGEGAAPAEYEPAKEITLVVVENYQHPADLQGPADQLAELLTRQLEEHKVAPLVAQSQLNELRAARPTEFAKMKITDLGRELGARQVVYVDLKHCEVNPTIGSDTLQGRVEAYVKVVDVASGLTKFPTVGEGRPFKSSGDFTPEEGSHTALAMRNQMIDELAVGIGQLFYATAGK